MSRSTVVISTLSLLLVATNLLWAYPHFSPPPPELAHEFRCAPDEHREELMSRYVQPLAAAIAASALQGSTKQSILAAAMSTEVPESNQFCIPEPGVEEVQLIGLRFNEDGKLVGASPRRCVY